MVGHNILNHGRSFGLQYPLIYGLIDERWTVWNRHTGEVVYIEDERNPALAESACSKKCEELNRVPAMDAETIQAIDDTP
jgi:hypothetical protein